MHLNCIDGFYSFTIDSLLVPIILGLLSIDLAKLITVLISFCYCFFKLTLGLLDPNLDYSFYIFSI